MKPLGIKNYGSIGHLSSSKLGFGDHRIPPGQESILTSYPRDKHDEIFVFEKYDGSNVGICKKDGRIIALTRAGYEAITSPYAMHHEFAKFVYRDQALWDALLNEGERICGEWMTKVHSIRYEVRGLPLRVFDWFDANNVRKPYDELSKLPLPLVRLLHRGSSIDPKQLREKLEKGDPNTRALSEKPEGMVYRVERKGKFDFAAKWVRTSFEPGKFLKTDLDNVLI